MRPGAAPSAWVDRSAAATLPWWSGGVYPNFPEPGALAAAYHAGNAGRLEAVKRRYDPEHVFAALA